MQIIIIIFFREAHNGSAVKYSIETTTQLVNVWLVLFASA